MSPNNTLEKPWLWLDVPVHKYQEQARPCLHVKVEQVYLAT